MESPWKHPKLFVEGYLPGVTDTGFGMGQVHPPPRPFLSFGHGAGPGNWVTEEQKVADLLRQMRRPKLHLPIPRLFGAFRTNATAQSYA